MELLSNPLNDPIDYVGNMAYAASNVGNPKGTPWVLGNALQWMVGRASVRTVPHLGRTDRDLRRSSISFLTCCCERLCRAFIAQSLPRIHGYHPET